MMGISSSSENEEDDNESLSSWDSSGSTEDQSSCLSQESAKPTTGIEQMANRTGETKLHTENITDLRILFNDSVLKKLASLNTKEDVVTLNVLQQQQSRILSWLNELNVPMSEAVVTQEMFCDFLMSKGVNRDDAIAAFSRFDTEGTGKADGELLQDGVQHLYEESENGELLYKTKILQSCNFLPGFIDVFSRTDPSSKHAIKLLHFLIRNRASAGTFGLPHLVGFEETIELRSNVCKHLFAKLQKETEEHKLLNSDSDGDVRYVGKPYSSIEVSSNPHDLHKLTDGDTGSYWQSDGAARSHWIRLHMKKNTVVKQLFVYVVSADQSYMPQEIVVCVGKRNSLKEVKKVVVPSFANGPVLLIENIKTYYPVVQINLKRCHSDGCDARIHQIRVSGLKILKESEMTITDASIKWFLQLASATAMNSISSSPVFRSLLVNQAKEAFKYIPPMSLCSGSQDKPKFLTEPVLSEVNSYLETLNCGANAAADDDDSLLCKIMYGLATCKITTLMSVMLQLIGDGDTHIDTGSLTTTMRSVKDSFWTRGEKLLPLNYVDCDGGEQKSESSGSLQPRELINYDSSNFTSDAYETKQGKTRFTLILESSETVQVTRLKIRAEKGAKGAKSGVAFLLPLSQCLLSKRHASPEKGNNTASLKTKSSLCSEEVKALYKRLEKYDTWTETDYQNFKGSQDDNTDGILTYFNIPDEPNDWDELDIAVSERIVGNIIVVKFLRPRSDTSDRIGVVGINVCGYSRTQDQLLSADQLIADGVIKRAQFCSSILSFLVAIIKSLEAKKLHGTKLAYVDFSGLTTISISQLFHEAQSYGDVEITRLVLQLCRAIFLNWTPNQDDGDTSQLFETFSTIINSPTQFDPSLLPLARAVIVDGAKAFFPNDQTRKDHLLRMLKDINRADELPSTSLVFESLCQFFSDVEPSALLELPKPHDIMKSSQGVELIDGSCLDVMDTLLTVTLSKSLPSSCAEQTAAPVAAPSVSSSSPTGVTYLVLVKLLSCLQTGMLSWYNRVLTLDHPPLTHSANHLLLTYLTKMISEYVTFTESILEKTDEQLHAIVSDGDNFVFTIVQQMVVFLLNYCKSRSSSETRMEIIRILWPFQERVHIIKKRLPSLFPTMESDKWTARSNDMVILNTWSEESAHNYHNNMHTTKVYNCPGAKLFILEFDSRCHTERKYDYLEFANFMGITLKYDQKVGTDTWPQRVEIKGSKLQFTFHSDQSNNEWGYKFMVTAKGVPETPINQLFDLHLSMALLLGEVCGQTIAMAPKEKPESDSCAVEKDNELLMLKSNLWKTLFRAGYQPSSEKVLQRSLSGRFAYSTCEEVKAFLLDMLSDPKAEPFNSLLGHIRRKCKMSEQLGCEEISSAILHTFCAFIYHTNDLCANLNEYIQGGYTESVLSEGIYQAYTLAEQLRVPMMQQRQKALECGDAPQFTLAKEMIDKAKLLLKFAALAKSSNVTRYNKTSKPIRKQTQRRVANSHLLKRLEGGIPAKYGQFQLILEFIVEPSWNCQIVERAIQERTSKAKSICMAYQFITDYLKLTDGCKGDVIQVDDVLLLKSVLKYQQGFTLHYADTVDGCGLEQESRLRQRFYSLIRLLMKFSDAFASNTACKNAAAAGSVMQACLLHLLDVEWRENDLQFLKEINLPEIFFKASQDNVAVRDRIETITDETTEMQTYERDKKSFSECQKKFTEWYRSHSRTKSKDVQMFIARHCDLLDVEIYCDGCNQSMPGRRYRCLDCVDMDLCVTCFTGGLNPGGEHKDSHSFVYFMYKCDVCQAFISGERVHCHVCDDFDLCYGCHKMKKTQPGHEADHDVIVYPQITLKSTCESNALASYIHQHAWVQFAQLTLSMAGAVFEQHEARAFSADSEDYTDTAATLLTQCLTLVTDCLRKVSTVDNKGGQTVNYREEVFVQHSQDRIMGLLGSIITLDEQYDAELNMMLTTTDFLKYIFYFASGNAVGVQHSSVQHLALGLLAQLMQKTSISTQVTDEAVVRTQKKSLSVLEGRESGGATIDFILQACTSCLDRQQGVDWSYSLIRLLQQLLNTPHWSAIMKKYLIDCMTTSIQTETNLKSVLCLFVLTGFPDIKSPGVTIQYLDYGSEKREAVILKHFPDRLQTMLIDTGTRKRKMVKDQLIIHSNTQAIFYDEHLVTLITRLFVENARKLMNGALFGIETHWVLSLCLKAFSQFVGYQVPYENLDVIRSLVNMAEMGTRLSKNWVASDLEILSLMLYIKLDDNPGNMTLQTDPLNPLNNSSDSAKPHADKQSSPGQKTPATEEQGELFPDMDEESRKHFMVLLEMLNVPMEHLKLVYDNHKESPSGLLQALHQLFIEESPDNLSKSKTRSPAASLNDKQDRHDNITEKMIDFGILPTSALPSAQLESVEDMEAQPESEVKTTKKVASPNTTVLDQKKSESARLLQCELGRLACKSSSHMHLNKVNLGLTILFARQALGKILANWSPTSPKINAELLNCESNNLALVLDVLNRDSSNLKQFEKVVSKVMSCCKEDYLQSIADSASSFMDFDSSNKQKEVVRESPHTPGKKIKGKIHIKGAAVLLLSFDKNCHTIGESSLQISTSGDMKKNFQSFSGSKWRDLEIPGDTIFYSYSPKGTGAGKWKFTVTAAGSSTTDSFFTGYVILNHILSTPSYCRVIDTTSLWGRLVVVACKQTGPLRLQAIQLLLLLLKSYMNRDPADTATKPLECEINLKHLTPLWRLYKTMSERQGPEHTSSHLRALTELFYVAENVSLKFARTGEFISCMVDPVILRPCFIAGIRNVTAVSEAIKYQTAFST